ncbi:MAG TPA: hypothetical protein VI318_19310 [Baekduia sp.]
MGADTATDVNQVADATVPHAVQPLGRGTDGVARDTLPTHRHDPAALRADAARSVHADAAIDRADAARSAVHEA